MRNKLMNLVLLSLLIFGGFSLVYAQNVQRDRMNDFLGFLKKVDAAQRELQNGRPAAFKELWSQSDDVTLSGGFGGNIERGWAAVGKRLDWAGQQFSNGTNTIDRLVAMSDQKLGYVVQLENIRFKAAETKMDTSRDYRVTMIFRLEKDGWRIVHRHADSQMTQQAPK